MGIFKGHITDQTSISAGMETYRIVEALKVQSYAEFGVGKKAENAVKVARVLTPGSHMHLFDFNGNMKAIQKKMAEFEDLKIHYYGHSYKNRDSYCWPLTKLILTTPLKEGRGLFDYVHLNGMCDLTVDGLAFYLCDKLLQEKGHIEFTKYDWTYLKSPSMRPSVREKTKDDYTKDMCGTAHIQLVVDALVKTDPRYKAVLADRLYRKRPYITRRIGRG